ncbi:MAG: 1-deoxy-D-xylulose-5-phosphate synthase [Bacillota bacterium]
MLEKVNGPADVRALPPEQLAELAAELRAAIVETVSRTGGHIAPSLGVVELTIALHRVFDSPRDKFVFDVGHQSYAHKLLTGRREEFSSLRQYGGLSGFPRRVESAHDQFDTGHASTSVSAALGMAKARDLKGEKHEVVAIIGDGAMTGGMAFEALNNAGHEGTDLIVVLNDNRMSIAPNVGALSDYLRRMRVSPHYWRFKADIEGFLRRVPGIGEGLSRFAERVKNSLKYLFVPGMLFEELGFTYLGPVDGHDLELLERVLTDAREFHGPVLVHVVTQKGRGYAPAENNPYAFHGPGPFDPDTGERLKSNGAATYSEVFAKTLVELAGEDERVVAITAAMPDGTGTEAMARQYPQRFFDVGIAEEHAMTFAAGLASQGMRPVFAVYSTFLQRATDQFIHDVALPQLPVVVAVDRAGIVGEDGPTHQGVFDLAILRAAPGIVLMSPKDENELRHMLKTALTIGRPAVIRYPRGQSVGVENDGPPRALPVGKGEVLREGRDVAIVALGNTVHPSLKAAEALAARGIDAVVINARFVKPLDRELILTWARRCGRVLTVEEHAVTGGFGSAVAEALAAEDVSLGGAAAGGAAEGGAAAGGPGAGAPGGVALKFLGIPDEFVPAGKPAMLRERYGLTPEGIALAAEAMFPERRLQGEQTAATGNGGHSDKR